MANAGNPATTVAPNVFQQSAGAYTGALGATGAAGGMNPGVATRAGSLFDAGAGLTGAGSAAPDISAFMNPYTAAVTDTTLAGLDRARQLAQTGVDAAATKAGAFGGSRHGVLGAETNRGFFDTTASTLAGLNSAGFNTALGGAQEQRQRQLQAGGQLGNMAQGLAGVGADQQRIQLAQGAQLGTLGQMLFGTGQSISGGLAQQGAQQQLLMQALIDAAKGQFGGFAGSATGSLAGPLAALSGANMGQSSSTTTQKPGLLNILGLALGAL